jgi:hypothetical protein
MVSYEVTATVDPALVDAYEEFMRHQHIPALLATGCFRAASLSRAAPGRYRMRCEAASRAELDRYLATHAARLREEFLARFPSGIALERELLDVLETWPAPAPP